MGYDRQMELWGAVPFTCVTFGGRLINRNVPAAKSFNNVRALLVREVVGSAGRELSYEGEDDVERKLGH